MDPIVETVYTTEDILRRTQQELQHIKALLLQERLQAERHFFKCKLKSVL